MKQNAYVAGVGMTPFGNAMDKTLNDLACASIKDALQDAGIPKEELNAAYMGNAAGGVITGQVCVPGQVALRSMGIGKIPVINSFITKIKTKLFRFLPARLMSPKPRQLRSDCKLVMTP